MQRMVVVLPAPLRPRNPRIRPGCTCRLRPRSTTRSPKDFSSPSTTSSLAATGYSLAPPG